MRFSTPITARTAPDTCQRASRKPALSQNAFLEPIAFSTASSMTWNAGPETAPWMSGASSSRQTLSRSRKPSRPHANSRNGTIAERIWKEIALAYVSRSFSTKPSTSALVLGRRPRWVIPLTASHYPEPGRVASVGSVTRSGDPSALDPRRGLRVHGAAAAQRRGAAGGARGDRRVAARQLQRPPVGAERLRAGAGRVPAHGRLAGRPLRPQA